MSTGDAAVALVCDLDGVVRHYDIAAQAAVELRYGLPEGSIRLACFSSPLLSDAISGRVSDRQWREAAAQTLTALGGEAAAEALREWSDLPVALAADVLGLLAQVREQHPVILLTNATDRLADDLERLGIGHVFDAIVNTSAVGTPKPGRAAFEAAAAAVGRVLDGPAPPERIAFVDDTRGHVIAAQALGWRGHVYLDAPYLSDFLDDCGLLRRA